MKKPDAIQAAFVNECIWLWRNRKAGVLRQPTHESAWFSPGEPTTAVKHNIWQSVLPQRCVALGQQHHPGLEAILLAWRRPTEENDRPPLPKWSSCQSIYAYARITYAQEHFNFIWLLALLFSFPHFSSVYFLCLFKVFYKERMKIIRTGIVAECEKDCFSFFLSFFF